MEVKINESYETILYPDILDNTWANIAKNIGLWEMIESEPMNYSDWKFNSNGEIKSLRKTYRKYVSEKIKYKVTIR